MAYEALLFCPEEKTARTVTQVLAELEFNVDPCTEPFAAVKKLMSQHFDAVVVDCDNEQNATLLFKSARNSTSNQASLAVAIVEGQAGVAKAFRIGANLVLTKPINVEQSKGTLRVARGLLRKGEPGKPAPAPTPAATTPIPPAPPTPVSTTSPVTAKPLATRPMPAAAKPAAPAGVRPAPAVKPPVIPSVQPSIPAVAAKAASAPAAEKTPSTAPAFTPASINRPAAPAPPLSAPPSAIPAKPIVANSFSSGAASAPAPAREPQFAAPAPVTPAVEPKLSETITHAEPTPSAAAAEPTISRPAPAAPSFTFGGANVAEPSSGASKKIIFGLVAAIVIAAAGYGGWTFYQGHRNSSVAKATPPAAMVPKPQTASQPATPAPAQPDSASSVAQPESQITETSTPTPAETTSTEPAGEKPVHPAKTSAKPSAVPVPKNPPAADVEGPAPLMVKSGSQPHVQAPAAPDATAPSMIGMSAPDSSKALSSLVSDQPTAKPVLQTMKISQGVAQGLIIKRVPPEYPRNALVMHIEGAVELIATISKDGDIKDVKVLKGDPQLSRAAVQAIKQWKYKPYLLNGEPVEIQTQITMNFNLPK